MKPITRWIIVVLVALSPLLGYYLTYHFGEANEMIAHRAPRVRTVPRFKSLTIAPEQVATPTVITRYEQQDTNLRKAIVKGPVIAQVELDRRLLTITTIDSLGNVQGATYSLKDLRRGVVLADGTTRLERRAKRRKTIKRIAIATAAVAGIITTLILTK